MRTDLPIVFKMLCLLDVVFLPQEYKRKYLDHSAVCQRSRGAVTIGKRRRAHPSKHAGRHTQFTMRKVARPTVVEGHRGTHRTALHVPLRVCEELPRLWLADSAPSCSSMYTCGAYLSIGMHLNCCYCCFTHLAQLATIHILQQDVAVPHNIPLLRSANVGNTARYTDICGTIADA